MDIAPSREQGEMRNEATKQGLCPFVLAIWVSSYSENDDERRENAYPKKLIRTNRARALRMCENGDASQNIEERTVKQHTVGMCKVGGYSMNKSAPSAHVGTFEHRGTGTDAEVMRCQLGNGYYGR